MEPVHWYPRFGPEMISGRTVQQVWEAVMPPGVAAQASDFLRAAEGWKYTQSYVRCLANSFEIRETIRDFMLMIFVTPARQGEDVPGFMDCLKESAARGLPLIMIPGKDLLADVVTTESYSEGAAFLFGARDEIAERCRVMLKGDLPRDFTPAAGDILEHVQPIAVDTAELFAGGNYIGAQAAATAVLDTLLAKAVGAHLGSLGHNIEISIYNLLKIINRSSPEDQDRALALTLIIPPAMKAFERADWDIAEYNRHATIHRVSPLQYTPQNALIALMHMSAVFVLLRCVGPDGFPPSPM